MNLGSLIFGQEERSGRDGRINGVVIGIVTNNQDPEAMGRIKVKFPWLSDVDESFWARIASPMAGQNRGLFFLPEVEDEVLVAFEHGDIRFPYVVGSLWNGKDTPPVDNGDGKNNIRIIRSRSGHVIRLNDEEGNETIEVVDKTEKNSIIIDTAKNTITITTDQDIAITAPNGTLKLEAKTIEIKSSAATSVEAGAGMDLKASDAMNLKGATINLN